MLLLGVGLSCMTSVNTADRSKMYLQRSAIQCPVSFLGSCCSPLRHNLVLPCGFIQKKLEKASLGSSLGSSVGSSWDGRGVKTTTGFGGRKVRPIVAQPCPSLLLGAMTNKYLPTLPEALR